MAPPSDPPADLPALFATERELVAGGAGGWDFHGEPGPRRVAGLSVTTEQAWRLLTNNMAVEDRAQLRVDGDERIGSVLLRTRAIIGTPR